MPLGQDELFWIVAIAMLVLSASSFAAGRRTRPRVSSSSASRPATAPIKHPTISAPRPIQQWLTAAEIAVLYVADWRKNGDTYQAQLTADLDRDIRNFCERYGIALLCAQEIRCALENTPGVNSRREILKLSNPRHQHAIGREKVLGLKSGRYVIWYCSRKAPRTGELDDIYMKHEALTPATEARRVSAKISAPSARARALSGSASSQSRVSQRPVTRSKADQQGDLLIGHELAQAA